jgi:hypothetical protein
MSPLDLASELQRLAGEASSLLPQDPASAAEKLERAHTLALDVAELQTAAGLSILLAQAWYVRNSLSRCIAYSRRAVREAPDVAGSHYTLAAFYEKAAMRASKARNTRRAAVLYSAAGREFGAAAATRTPGRALSSFARAAEDSMREADAPPGSRDGRGR